MGATVKRRQFDNPSTMNIPTTRPEIQKQTPLTRIKGFFGATKSTKEIKPSQMEIKKEEINDEEIQGEEVIGKEVKDEEIKEKDTKENGITVQVTEVQEVRAKEIEEEEMRGIRCHCVLHEYQGEGIVSGQHGNL